MSRSLEPPLRMEELLRHAGWLRGLAGHLVGDPGRAADLVQDTWLAALRRPPHAGVPPRRWLERVFRNLARNRQRDERTRAAHESRALEPRPGPEPEAIAREVEAQRLLAEAVGALPEPARTIVVLRYFRGLDSGAIGRELGLPAGTVRWKLQAALEELRRALDRRFEGGRKAWSLLFTRVLGPNADPLATLTISWPGLVATAVALVGVGWWSLPRGSPSAAVPARLALETDGGELEEVVLARPARSAAQAAMARSEAENERRTLATLATPPLAREPGPDIEGSVLVDGAPSRGAIDLELVVHGTLTRKLSTDEDGNFVIFAAGTGTHFTLCAPGYLLESEAAVWGPWSDVTPSLHLVLRLLTPPALRGRVVTPDGQPVPNAPGVYDLRAEASDWSLDSGRGSFSCDGEGRFKVRLLDLMSAGMPKFHEGECEATLLIEVPRVGRRLLETGRFRAADLDLGDIVLEGVRTIAFGVRDERGLPLSSAVARLDDHWLTEPSSPTNREGRGELRHAPDRPVRVRFSALGFADRVLLVELGDEPEVWLDPIPLLEVQLEPPADTYGPFPELVLTADQALFEPTDAPQWELALDVEAIQTELGASQNGGHGYTKSASGLVHTFRFVPDAGGRALIAALRAGVSFTLTACDATGRQVARCELVMGPGERRRIALPCDE